MISTCHLKSEEQTAESVLTRITTTVSAITDRLINNRNSTLSFTRYLLTVVSKALLERLKIYILSYSNICKQKEWFWA